MADQKKDIRRFFSPEYLAQHPELGESLLPVWGSAREAVADYYEGDYGGAAVNGLLAAADLIPGSALAKTAYKTARYGGKVLKTTATDPTSWKNARRWMGKQGDLAKGQHGHHWLVEQNSWLGKHLPKGVTNAPWNIKGMPVDDPIVHRRIHGRARIPETNTWLPRYGAVERYVRGAPTGVHAAAGVTAAHQIGVGKRAWDERDED